MDRFASTGAPAGGASPVRRGWPAVWFLALMVLALCGGTWPAGTHAAASGPGPPRRRRGPPLRPRPAALSASAKPARPAPFSPVRTSSRFCARPKRRVSGKPLVDNYDGIGMAVYDDDGGLLGYSRYCSVPTRIYYVYRSTDGTFKPLPDRAAARPILRRPPPATG